MGAFVRVLTAGWSGIRPGEQAALDDPNCWLYGAEPKLHIDEEKGSLEKLSGHAPRLKTPKSGLGREVLVPLGLAALLLAWIDFKKRQLDASGPNPAPPPRARIVFPAPSGARWERSNWNSWWRDSNDHGVLLAKGPSRHGPAGEYVLERATPHLEYKGLRRFYNTMLTDIGCPDVQCSLQLGHAVKDELRLAYANQSPYLNQRMLSGLQERWVEAFSGYAGVAALEIVRQFAPDFGPVWDEPGAVALSPARLAITSGARRENET